MPGGGVRAFGELEAAIMDQVWAAGRPVLVREIHDGLRPEREPWQQSRPDSPDSSAFRSPWPALPWSSRPPPP
jgi:hypothetical protein